MGREQRSGRRVRGDHGSALVESAIILPFLAIMIFGIVELGFLYRSASIVNSSSRSGARFAASQYAAAKTPLTQATVVDNVRLTVEKDLQSRGTTDTPVQLWVYKADNRGNPPPGDFSSCATDCFVLPWIAATRHFASPLDVSTGSWPDPDGCGKVIDSIGVWLQVTHVPLGFTSAFGTITLKEKTVMRLEPRTDCTTPEK
jgi:hypothetical protein